MRRAAKVDGNHELIAEVLRAAGCSVQSLAALGKGVPDLLCAVSGISFLLEVKDPARPPSARRLTPDQKKWHAGWCSPVHLVETPEQAMWIVQHYKKRGRDYARAADASDSPIAEGAPAHD